MAEGISSCFGCLFAFIATLFVGGILLAIFMSAVFGG